MKEEENEDESCHVSLERIRTRSKVQELSCSNDRRQISDQITFSVNLIKFTKCLRLKEHRGKGTEWGIPMD